ncbi:hypothetical protein GCM10009720_18770 [Yaniella flava]|uniref:Uncharacterized protein n=1 Tax=Yaniella flava TaxID=287930 RepID=A0ABN2UJT6_9MICC
MIGGFMRNSRGFRIVSADFAFEMKLCIVISRAQGRPETGSAETQKFFLEKIYSDPDEDEVEYRF